MALNKFLFTSAQRQSLIADAGRATQNVGKSLNEFGNDQYQATLQAGASTDVGTQLTTGPHLLLAGLEKAGAGAVSGIGWITQKLGELAGKVIFQEMFLNPDKMGIKYVIPNNLRETQGGIVVNHWRPKVPEISMSGAIGWIRNESILDSAIDSAAKSFISGGNGVKGFATTFDKQFGEARSLSPSLSSIQKFREQASNLVNSPRKFLDELRTLALSPMYYKETFSGIEKYNAKKIIVFTKQYPDGAAFEGYFNSFDVDESGTDSETIKYSFSYVALNIAPIGITERIGQFIAPFFGAAQEITGGIANTVGGGISNLIR